MGEARPSCPKLPERTRRRDTRHIPASLRVYFAHSRAASPSPVASIDAHLSLAPRCPPRLKSPGSPPPRRDREAAPPPPHTKRPPAATGLLRATPHSPPQPAAYEQGGTAPSGGGIGIAPAPAAAHRRGERRAPVPVRPVLSPSLSPSRPRAAGKEATERWVPPPGDARGRRERRRCSARPQGVAVGSATRARRARCRERGAARTGPRRQRGGVRAPLACGEPIAAGRVQSPGSERLPRTAASP